MKIGDKVTIGGEDFYVRFAYNDYILVSKTTSDLETLAASTLVFKVADEQQLKLIKDKEEIKIVITKLFELIQGRKLTEDDKK